MQLFIISLLLLGVSLGSASPSELSEVKLERGGCPMFWFSFNGRCYKYVASDMTWADAELYCVSEWANLVSIHSREENNFVKYLILNSDPTQQQTWIGLNDIAKERGWMWSDGSTVDFSQWNTGEPNNAGGNEDCALVNFGSELKWNDGTCSDRRPSVCVSRKPGC